MSVSTLKSEAKSLTQPMTELQRQYILLTQNGLPIVAKPFNWLAEQLGISLNNVLTMTKDMQNKGIIRRIAAVPNHYKLGYTHNGMTVWDVVDSDASRLGKLIGELPLLVTVIYVHVTYHIGIIIFLQWYMAKHKATLTSSKLKYMKF